MWGGLTERVSIPRGEVRRTSESFDRTRVEGGEFTQAEISASTGERWIDRMGEEAIRTNWETIWSQRRLASLRLEVSEERRESWVASLERGA